MRKTLVLLNTLAFLTAPAFAAADTRTSTFDTDAGSFLGASGNNEHGNRFGFAASSRAGAAGALTHDQYGVLPADKAAVFWMEHLSNDLARDQWKMHVIRWCDGVDSGQTWTAEKWDHLRFLDINGDGLLDILANCEEKYINYDIRFGSTFGVVWFENPLGTQRPKPAAAPTTRPVQH